MRRLFVGIEGSIGIGKSTLAKWLSERLGYQPMYEPVDTNPYLSLFYGDMERWGAIMQLHLLHARKLMHLRARVSAGGVVQDRTIYGDTVFARNLHDSGLMSDLEWDTYMLAWESMVQTLVYPDIVVFLDGDTATCQQRIRDRMRAAESGIPDEYLDNLRKGYDVLHDELSDYTVCRRYDWSDPDVNKEAVLGDINGVAMATGFTWARQRMTMLPDDVR
jgi:deoxyadenosine kinase